MLRSPGCLRLGGGGSRRDRREFPPARRRARARLGVEARQQAIIDQAVDGQSRSLPELAYRRFRPAAEPSVRRSRIVTQGGELALGIGDLPGGGRVGPRRRLSDVGTRRRRSEVRAPLLPAGVRPLGRPGIGGTSGGAGHVRSFGGRTFGWGFLGRSAAGVRQNPERLFVERRQIVVSRAGAVLRPRIHQVASERSPYFRCPDVGVPLTVSGGDRRTQARARVGLAHAGMAVGCPITTRRQVRTRRRSVIPFRRTACRLPARRAPAAVSPRCRSATSHSPGSVIVTQNFVHPRSLSTTDTISRRSRVAADVA